MNGRTLDDEALPQHVAASVESLLGLQRRHDERASRDQRFVERATRLLGRPRTVFTVFVIVVAWVAVNLALLGMHRPAPDPPPFYWLETVASAGALFMSFFILTTENRLGIIAERRSQLNLQLTLLTETKVAKLIELVEQMRHDDPDLADRIDADAIAMTLPADPHAVIEALETHDPRDA